MVEPLISIVLPVYNGSRYLEESLQSCLQQTYSNWELIIVDDCSTDSTPEIISKYLDLDHRIRGVRHEKNRKLPGGLNTGFPLAKGEYLTWTSDDNRFRPEALAELVAYLENHPQVDLVYSDFSLMAEDGRELRHVTVKDPDALAFTNCVGPCFLYRRAVQERLGGYDDAWFGVEDYDFYLRASRFFQFRTLHKDLYLYRYNNEGALSITHLTRIMAASEKLRALNLPQMAWVSHEARSEGYLRLAYYASRRRDVGMTCKYLLRAFWFSPSWVCRRFLRAAGALLRTQKFSSLTEGDHLEIRHALRGF